MFLTVKTLIYILCYLDFRKRKWKQSDVCMDCTMCTQQDKNHIDNNKASGEQNKKIFEQLKI